MANHRAGKRIASPVDSARAEEVSGRRAATTAGKRKAVKPSRVARLSSAASAIRPPASGRRSGIPTLPSTPTLVGAAALVVAAAGAVTVSEDPVRTPVASGGIHKLSAASVLSGTSAVVSTDISADRERAVSRDSQREALQDAAEEELLAAAEAQAKERNAALAQLAANAEEYADEIAANRWVLPLSDYRITAEFGYSSSLWASTHTGLDFAAPLGAPVMSVANGEVTSTGYAGSYGNRVIVTLDDGTEIWYCHLTSFTVSPGESVTAGQTVGTVGSTGNSTGPHLHLEVRPGAGDPVDPYAALVAHGLNP